MAKRKNRLVLLFKIAISATILSVLVYQAVNDRDVRQLVQQPKNWEWFAAALAAQAIGYTISHIRWWVLANAVGVRLSLFQAIRIGYVALAFHLIAFGVAGGDVLRAVYVCRDHPEQKPMAISSVILDRGIGLVTMFSCVTLAAIFIDWSALSQVTESTSQGLSNGLKIICWVSAVVTMLSFAGLLTILVAGGPRWLPRIRSIIKPLPAGRFMMSLVDVVALYRSRPAAMLSALVLSLGVVASLSVCVFCLARGLTSETPTLGQHFIITPISLIAGAVPLPMGIGSQELAMSLLYRWFSTETLNADYGLLVAIGYRLITFLLMGVGVGFYFWQGKESRDELDRVLESEDVRDAD